MTTAFTLGDMLNIWDHVVYRKQYITKIYLKV